MNSFTDKEIDKLTSELAECVGRGYPYLTTNVARDDISKAIKVIEFQRKEIVRLRKVLIDAGDEAVKLAE